MIIKQSAILWLLTCLLIFYQHGMQAKTVSLELIYDISLDTTGDTDGDQLSDGLEFGLLGTSFDLADSDGDGQSDFFEALIKSNPLSKIPLSQSQIIELIADFDLDTTGDVDKDGLSNGMESILLGLDPNLGNTDRDQLSDFEEILRGLNPHLFANPIKVETTLDVIASLVIDTTSDSDGDLLTDGVELNLFFTQLNQADSDLDGINDFREILLRGNPFKGIKSTISQTLNLLARLQLDTTVDRDQDGLSDGIETHVTFTDIQLVDTDGDGLSDDIEILFGGNPFLGTLPPNPIQPVLGVEGVVDGTLQISVFAEGAKVIILEESREFNLWNRIDTITFEEGDGSAKIISIPINTEHSFFRIITVE
ncbi:hypothetical protein OAM01_01885 [bacterium]|nr:hypothetical protein [bacterium]